MKISIVVLLLCLFANIVSADELYSIGIGRHYINTASSDIENYKNDWILNTLSVGKNFGPLIYTRITYRDYGKTKQLSKNQQFVAIDPVTAIKYIDTGTKNYTYDLSLINFDVNLKKKFGSAIPYFGLGYGVAIEKEKYTNFTEFVSQKGEDIDRYRYYKINFGIIYNLNRWLSVEFTYNIMRYRLLNDDNGFHEYGINTNLLF